jgi:toxin ParE1/3/4
MPSVIKSPAATDDLLEIWLYIAQDNLAAGDALIDSIDDKCRVLAEHPQMGRRRTELGSDLHSFAEGRYVVFYRVRSDGIEIVRVLHGARDIPRLFES